MFGSNVTYDLVDSQYTKSDYTSDITLYATEVIEIRYPKISSQDQLYPLCLFNSFGLEWNADDKNENGVMVVIEWHGGWYLEKIIQMHIFAVQMCFQIQVRLV